MTKISPFSYLKPGPGFLDHPDNLIARALEPTAPTELCRKPGLLRVDAIVASARVQMPSLTSIHVLAKASALPTLLETVTKTRQILKN